MFSKLFRFFVPSKNTRELRRMGRIVARINALEESIGELSDAALRAKTAEFRQRFQDGETLDKLLPEAFACVREASRRALGMRHFDVQLIGGITLHEGRIAEMRTGEGKTLVATLPAYLNALSGAAVHLVTVNDYLARRDADWMGPIYQFLGLTVGSIQSGLHGEARREAYAADITYGTNNEFGFDYLRDNMAFRKEDRVQRGLGFAIVDEVDSILIDEARTPLIITGPTEDRSELYRQINGIIPSLVAQIGDEEEDPEGFTPGDYVIDEKNRTAELTEDGHEKIEQALIELGLLAEDDSLYSAANLRLLHHVQAGLRAHTLFRRDVQYIIQNNEVVIVDEHTGRTMPGRRWGDGTHQAIEAKEGLPVQSENQTVASTTYQNYFRLYDKLSGMTGTADTEAVELHEIYGLTVVVIPTNRPMVRRDENDLVFMSEKEKYDAIVEDIADCRERGQPVLVGTASVESSERLDAELQQRGIPHNVLNAKQHEREAHIIAQAGRPGAVTIATNMAGRGTDIMLGGNWEFELSGEESESEVERLKGEWQALHDQVIEAGGLHIIGTERHESRRIDNQLRGRAGRQGDPGSSRFYLSLDDPLMRIFARGRIRKLMESLRIEEGQAIEAGMVNRAIERAQRQVEGHNFDIRKNLLEFDDVASDQRLVIYAQRNELLESDDISEAISQLREDVFDICFERHVPPQSLEEQWDLEGLQKALETDFNLHIADLLDWPRTHPDDDADTLRSALLEQLVQAYDEKMSVLGDDARMLEKQVMLQQLDQHWKDHLLAMDQLRYSIHLRAYAQKQPKQEYKQESYHLFQGMLEAVKQEVIHILCKIQIRSVEEVEAEERARREAEAAALTLGNADPAMQAAAADPDADRMAFAQDGRTDSLANDPARSQSEPAAQPFKRETPKVGRNEPCPCGSGKKYKHCHGKL